MSAARGLAVVLAVGILGTSAYGLAAGLNSGSGGLGTSQASVARCDTDGVSILQNLSGTNVSSVTVGSIASACGLAAISVNMNNGAANSSGSGTVPAGGGSVTITLASAVAVDDSGQIDVVISGP